MKEANATLSWVARILGLLAAAQAFTNRPSAGFTPPRSTLVMSSTSASATAPTSWSDIQTAVGKTSVGKALNDEVSQRKLGLGSAHVHNTLRKFDLVDEDNKEDAEPRITLYRDYAGWCPYWYESYCVWQCNLDGQFHFRICLSPALSCN